MAPLLSSILQYTVQAVDAVKEVQAVAPPPIAPQLDGELHTLSVVQSVDSAACYLIICKFTLLLVYTHV